MAEAGALAPIQELADGMITMIVSDPRVLAADGGQWRHTSNDTQAFVSLLTTPFRVL